MAIPTFRNLLQTQVSFFEVHASGDDHRLPAILMQKSAISFSHLRLSTKQWQSSVEKVQNCSHRGLSKNGKEHIHH